MNIQAGVTQEVCGGKAAGPSSYYDHVMHLVVVLSADGCGWKRRRIPLLGLLGKAVEPGIDVGGQFAGGRWDSATGAAGKPHAVVGTQPLEVPFQAR